MEGTKAIKMLIHIVNKSIFEGVEGIDKEDVSLIVAGVEHPNTYGNYGCKLYIKEDNQPTVESLLKARQKGRP